jgi:hypothetical protein
VPEHEFEDNADIDEKMSAAESFTSSGPSDDADVADILGGVPEENPAAMDSGGPDRHEGGE